MIDKANILIVDDNINLCRIMSLVLEHKGYAVATVNDGQQAIERIKERSYDIVFIDMKLPTINGLETYLAIREINPKVVAMIMTAYSQEMADLVTEALNNHAYMCLYKPLDMEEVLALVGEIWEKRQHAEVLDEGEG